MGERFVLIPFCLLAVFVCVLRWGGVGDWCSLFSFELCFAFLCLGVLLCFAFLCVSSSFDLRASLKVTIVK